MDGAPGPRRDPFEVVNGRPVNLFGPTGIRRWGRNEMGRLGALLDDARRRRRGYRQGQGLLNLFLLMVEREDGHGWAVPGGHVDDGEACAGMAASARLEEETGLDAMAVTGTVMVVQAFGTCPTPGRPTRRGQ